MRPVRWFGADGIGRKSCLVFVLGNLKWVRSVAARTERLTAIMGGDREKEAGGGMDLARPGAREMRSRRATIIGARWVENPVIIRIYGR